ncbi:MAG: PAS domain S-box protein [Planctomycetia bacterium]|nr:PAS domain S-box protein [Planctomycetia bacterium]
MTDSFWQEMGGTLFEEAGDALFLFDPDTEQVHDVNPMAQRLSGYNRRELLELKITQIIRSDVEGGLQRMRLAFRRTGLFHSQEGFWLRNKGNTPWVPVNLTITRLHARPKILGLITARDITERREAQLRLQESEQRYRTLFDTSMQGILIHQNDVIRFGNPALARMFGYDSCAELIGLNLWETLIAPEEWPQLKARTDAFYRGEQQPIHPGWLGRRKDGSPIWVQATASLITWEGKPAICAFFLDITERKVAEEALRESESRHRVLLEQVPAIVWSTDADLRLVSSIGAGLAVIGETPNQNVGKLLTELLGDDPEFVPLAAHHQALLGEPVNYQTEWKGRHWHTYLEPLRDAEQQITGVIGVTLDITERHQAEQALRESQRALSTLMSNLPGMAYRCRNDPHWTMEIVSEGVTALTGYRPDDLIDNRRLAFSDLIHADDRQTVWDGVQAALTRHEPYQLYYRLRTAGGEEKWVWEQGQGIFTEDGQLTALEGFVTDITARRQAEEGLRASEARYRSLVENLSHSIFLKDRELRFVAVNPPFCRNFGKSAADLIGKDDFAIAPPHLAEKYRADDRRVMEERRRLDLEEQTVINGKLRTVQCVKTPVLDAQGEVIGVLGIFWDVTEQRNLEAQLRQAHKMEAVGQLAGGIAHDFNNLLTGILGNLSLSLADLPATHSCRDLLTNAELAALRAAELTRQLLGFSRRTPLTPQAVDLNAVIEETIRLVRRTFDPRIEVRLQQAADLWSIQADPGQMGQVLMNLCLNARDAMPNGGALTLETANVRLDPQAVEKSFEGRTGDFVRLRVCDTGVGMTREVREHIFEPFFTTKETGKGTGLGLAMVFGIVKAHGGWIECQSELTRGTTFDVFLPGSPQLVAAPPAAAPDGIKGGNETILLADDEQIVGRLGATILRRHGYRVLSAADGLEALEVFRQQRGGIDLVILDLSMPRLSGQETLRELRKLKPTVKVLISSGYSSEDEMRAVEREGVMGFVAKPYRPAELARQVRRALDWNQTPSSS